MGLQVHQLPPSVPRKWGISVAGKITAGTVRVLSLFAVLLLVFTLHNAQSGHRFTYGDGEGSAVKSSGAPGAHPACECGDWQPWYTDLHRKIVSGDLPPRFLVVTGVESGLADRLVRAQNVPRAASKKRSQAWGAHTCACCVCVGAGEGGRGGG